MKRVKSIFIAAAVLIASGWMSGLVAETLRVAVAANFTATMKMVASAYEEVSKDDIMLAFGSTGKLYAQIKNGAPFDMFLAADVRRPRLLEKEKIAVLNSRYTYAMGKIILWSPDPDYVDDQGNVLGKGDFRFISLANPKLAPYGQAAVELLDSRGLADRLAKRIVFGENISQTYQYIISGNAKLGFIALSQVMIPGKTIEGSYWEPPAGSYEPIEQQLVILNDVPTAWAFREFLRGDTAVQIIRSFGYAVKQ